MKSTVFVIVSILLTVSYSCQQKVDIEKEKQSILSLVQEESASYYGSSFDRWSATYLNDSTLYMSIVSKGGPFYLTGWKDIEAYWKPDVSAKKDLTKEIKTPRIIKVTGNTAFIVFENDAVNDKGELLGKGTVTCFLEKKDGNWKIAYRNVIFDDSYSQPDDGLMSSVSYAKSLGKNVEDVASFTGDLFKTSWTGGYDGFVNGIQWNWNLLSPKHEVSIIDKDKNHVIFTVDNVFTSLKSGPQKNVTYDDYLNFLKVISEKIADYSGATYIQETTPNGVKITITRK